MPLEITNSYLMDRIQAREWPVAGINGFRIRNGILEYELIFSKYDENCNYVGEDYPDCEFLQWTKYEELDDNIKELTAFYGITADFKYDEFGTRTEDGYDTSEPTDPDDWVVIVDD